MFPAGATLVEKHERERKQKAGITQTRRGRKAAALDAYGAALGAAGLLCFGLVVWQLMPGHSAALVLIAGKVAWIMVSILLWRIRKSPLVALGITRRVCRAEVEIELDPFSLPLGLVC